MIIHSQDTRNLFFRMRSINIPIKIISLYLEICVRTLYRWLKQGPIKPINPTRVKNKNKYQQIYSFINDKITEDNTLTLKKLNKCIYDKFYLTISLSTLHRVLISMNLTYKKGSKYYTEANVDKQKQFLQNIKTMKNIISLDEACFFLNETKKYARSLKGKKAVIKRKGNRGHASSLLLSINKNGIVKWSLYHKSISSVDFKKFLEELPINSTVVLDNARIHHASNKLEKEGFLSIKNTAINKNITLNYLPPYSPYLNPVEFCFNIIRHYISSERPTTFEELRNCISKSMSLITKETINSIIKKIWP